jgi:hypothetical protein
MPVTVEERPRQRKQDGKSAERAYLIRGAATEGDARTALLTNVAVPSTLGSFIRKPESFAVEELAEGDIWEGVAYWASPEFSYVTQAGSFSIGFDITGETQHITQSRETIQKIKGTDQPTRDFQGAINVSSNFEVGGVDVITPKMTLNYNYTVYKSFVTDAYIQTLYDTVGKVNTDSFLNFAAGTALLTGVSGSKKDEQLWDLKYQFMLSPNITAGIIKLADKDGASTDQTYSKKGWEYLWVYYTEMDHATDKVVNKIPTHAYVEKVYETTAFSALNVPQAQIAGN